MNPCAARAAQEQSAGKYTEQQTIAEPNTHGQHARANYESRPDQIGPEHVRVLEHAVSAVVEREQVPCAARHVEVAQDDGDCRDERSRDIRGAERAKTSLSVACEQTGENDRGK